MEKEIIQYTMPSLKFNINVVSYHQSNLWRKSHVHDALEIVFVTEGRIRVRILNEDLLLSKGDAVIINSGIIHSIENEYLSEIIYMQIEMSDYFNFNNDLQIYRFISCQNLLPYCLITQNDNFAMLLLAIQKEINEKKRYYDVCVRAYIGLLVPFMLRNNIIADVGKQLTEEATKLLPVANYIERNYIHSISLEHLAEIIGYDKFKLCRKFKKITGKTIVEYINYIRIYHAKKLLKDSSESITDIAFGCGFSSVQYFNVIFKRYIGCTPTDYRRHYD